MELNIFDQILKRGWLFEFDTLDSLDLLLKALQQVCPHFYHGLSHVPQEHSFNLQDVCSLKAHRIQKFFCRSKSRITLFFVTKFCGKNKQPELTLSHCLDRVPTMHG